MNARSGLLDDIKSALRPNGLFVRGVAVFGEGDGPLLRDGRHAASVVLVGNAGGSFWEAFDDWHRQHVRAVEHPLDTWSKQVIGEAAERFGATAYYPSDPPYQPFQQWAMHAEGLKASPLGILIHPEFGLWHGYRGALGFSMALAASGRVERHPCDHCPDKPCLTSCPVAAIRMDSFDVAACRSHLATPTGQAGCMMSGCLARNACPVGEEHRYPEGQIRFHMRALTLPAV
ncbi:ferredoxin [Ciceribacter sp. L1K22]|uniref:ferredoxin n=1 Tax=Ciceribacter sp. L1K22 TaxID=2820275 RepID=UPI001ABE5CBC|nr:ferredoxin [Ciceribacter sp. L1K22]MBO3760420.1 ferredoxin [Ciceribacter sp. L1K22]